MELVLSGMCCLFQGKALEGKSQAQHNAELTGDTQQLAPACLPARVALAPSATTKCTMQ